MPMTIRGKFRGFDVALRLTKREAVIFERARSQGFLVVLGRLGMVEHAWEIDCGLRRRPCVILRKGRSTASLTFDLATMRDLELDDEGQREVRLLLFRASCKAPNPAAKGRMRRRIISRRYVYGRVPLICAEATARALLKIDLSETEESQRRLSYPFQLADRS
jgi:hypothetical protein